MGWDITDRTVHTRLKGHRSALCGLQLVTDDFYNVERTVTADESGCFKLWDLRPQFTLTAVCLQTFSLEGCGAASNLAFVAAHPARHLIAAGNKRLRLFDYRQIRTAGNVAVCACYNSLFGSILTAGGLDHMALWTGGNDGVC